MYKMNEKKKGIYMLAGFALAMLAVTILLGKPILSAVSDPEAFRIKIEGYGWAGRIIFFLMMFVQTVIAFIPGEPLEIAAGYAFGAFEGTLLCIAGQAAGSICVFLFVRKFGMKLVRIFVSEEKISSLRFLKNEKKLDALVFFVFLLPGTPKDALCYFVGLTPMRLWVWMLISSSARIPSVITSTIGGNALGMGRIFPAIIVFVLTVIISVSGYLLYGRILKRRENHAAKDKKNAREKMPRRMQFKNTSKKSA